MNLFTSICQLDNLALVRLFLRKIWIMYSAGGISHHRSLQASLLEGFMDLIPLPQFDSQESVDDIAPFDALFVEIQSRSLCYQTDFDFFSVERTVCTCLAGLRRFYELDLETCGDPTIYHDHWKKKWIDAACKLLPLPSLTHITSKDGLQVIAHNARSFVADYHLGQAKHPA